MWKDLLDKSKCLLGFHEGPWNYRQARNCTQSQKCQRCGKQSERVEHSWGEWGYLADERCDFVRTCGRCSEVESNLSHPWGEPQYVRAGACDRLAVCSRCGENETREPVHVFDAWSYQTPDACTQIQVCSRCNAASTATRLEHDWDGWLHSAFYASQVRVCRHCGEMLVSASASAAAAAVSMQAIEADVNRLIAADTPQAIRSTLSASATLLTPASDKYFQFAFDQYPDDDFKSGALTVARALVSRCREAGVDATLQELGVEASPAAPAPAPVRRQAASSPPTAGDRDSRLVGHWRSTEILGAGTPMSMVIDTHCVLDASGRFEFTSPEWQSGTWTTRGKELTLAFDAGDSYNEEYFLQGNSMMWPRSSRYRLWERVG